MAGVLARLSSFGPYFSLRAGTDGATGWRPVRHLIDPGGAAVLLALVERVTRRLGTTHRRVAASVLFQGWASRLACPLAAGFTLERRIPDLAAASLVWRQPEEGPVELALLAPTLAGLGGDDIALPVGGSTTSTGFSTGPGGGSSSPT